MRDWGDLTCGTALVAATEDCFCVVGSSIRGSGASGTSNRASRKCLSAIPNGNFDVSGGR